MPPALRLEPVSDCMVLVDHFGLGSGMGLQAVLRQLVCCLHTGPLGLTQAPCKADLGMHSLPVGVGLGMQAYIVAFGMIAEAVDGIAFEERDPCASYRSLVLFPFSFHPCQL